MSENIKSVRLVNGKLILEIVQKGEIISGTGCLPKDFLVTQTYVSDDNRIVLETSTKEQL